MRYVPKPFGGMMGLMAVVAFTWIAVALVLRMLDDTVPWLISREITEVKARLDMPVIGSAQPADTNGPLDLLVLDVDERGNVRSAKPEMELDSYLEAEVNLASAKLGLDPDHVKAGEFELPTIVVIRAERNTKFIHLNRIVETCQEHGLRQYVLRVKKPPIE